MPSRSSGPLGAGQRDRTIVIQQRSVTDTAGDSGEPEETWTTLVTMPAAKGNIGGSERFFADQMTARYDTRWEINYRQDMDPELIDVPKVRRVLVQGRVHDIVAAAEIGRREAIELLTLARVG